MYYSSESWVALSVLVRDGPVTDPDLGTYGSQVPDPISRHYLRPQKFHPTVPLATFILTGLLGCSDTLSPVQQPTLFSFRVHGSIPTMKRNYHLEHVYTGEEQPIPVALGTVSIFVAGKRKKARVVTQPFCVPRTDADVVHQQPPGPPPGPTTSFDIPPAATEESASDVIGGCDAANDCNAIEGAEDSQKVHPPTRSFVAVLKGPL